MKRFLANLEEFIEYIVTAICNALFAAFLLSYIGALSTGQFSCFGGFFWSTAILFAFAPIAVVRTIVAFKWLWCMHENNTKDKEEANGK